jgi:peptidoglycan/xylan/chitin deacetylase (PgdA/CDA1 family)
MKRTFYLVLTIILLVAFAFFLKEYWNKKNLKPVENEPSQVTPSPTPTPTPRPLTFAEMNALYGPCVYLPVLMYHHVQEMEVAKQANQTSLTVTTDVFRAQMQYLKNSGYTTVSPVNIISFFDSGAAVGKKSVLITFDDGYADFSLNALPILREFGLTATVFIPTGLVGNPGYLSWQQIGDAASSGIFFGNHTWSHKNVKQPFDVLQKEITTADTQLSERGTNSPKIFAYPYGFSSTDAEKILSSLNYSLAFTTKHGGTLCKKQRYDLPRIRIGNSSLSAYGL